MDSLSAAGDDEPIKLDVPFQACIDQLTASEFITDFLSSETGTKGTAQKRTRIRTFPQYLMVHMRKYYLASDWTPKKLDVSVVLPEELDLEHLRGTGLVEGEELLPETPDTGTGEPVADATPEAVVPDANVVAQVVSMGFSENGAKRAAVATNNASADVCMDWVLSHMGDADFNDPIPELVADATVSVAPVVSAGVEEEPSVEFVEMLTGMGFTVLHAKGALQATGGSLERAADWLFSHADDLDAAMDAEAAKPEGNTANGTANIISVDSSVHSSLIDGLGKYEMVGFASHMGSNTACGHYVAHVKKEGRFVLFNDEKVAVSQMPPLGLGFLYLYKRIA
jgi:ubiquitin carboxyl-terminal hydrolase 5/13